jgi:D-alanyl-D-alanine carboxypeptidase
MPPITRRSFFSAGTAGAMALAASRFTVVDLHAAPAAPKVKNTPDAMLDNYAADYMRAMNAPGMTFGSANKAGTVRVTAYGFDDPEQKLRVSPNELFHIGSITKSFVALVLLQLREEGKLDFERPVFDYLPWLAIENTFGAITTHHLLTHTSGLPDALTLFPSDRNAKWQQAYKPGEKFYYSNLGFDILGHLIESLDGRTWPSAAKARVIDRVGMTATRSSIIDEMRPETAKSWVPYYEDRPYPRQGKLAPSGAFQLDDAAGSIASTAKDMSLYAQMLLNHGQCAGGRVISEESFAVMSKAHIKAEEFGPTASYGYGIAVDTLDKHPVLRHTGGMPSFASAILLDLESGNGAFASINAMQGYRPTAIVQYAVQLMNLGAAPKSMPVPPVISDPKVIDNGPDYVGSYVSTDGKRLDISGDKQLFATTHGRKVALEHIDGDTFLGDDPIAARYTFNFGRAKAPEKESESKAEAKPEDKPKPQPVVELSHGPDWYHNDRYTGPTDFKVPDTYKPLVGYYVGGGAFPAQVEILVRKGELWMEGAFKLIQVGENEFVPDGGIPERAEFLFVVGGKARLLKFSGTDMWRFERS